MDDVNSILNRIVHDSPGLQKLFSDRAPNIRKFSTKLRWHYHDTGNHSRFRRAYFCYSINRNKNGKFISWIYDWKGDRASFCLVREHVRRKSAKVRALRLYDQRMQQIKEAEEQRNLDKSVQAVAKKDLEDRLI